MDLKCREKGCNLKFRSYRGRIDHERAKHGVYKHEVYDCGRRKHKHKTFNGAKQCRYRRKLKKKLKRKQQSEKQSEQHSEQQSELQQSEQQQELQQSEKQSEQQIEQQSETISQHSESQSEEAKNDNDIKHIQDFAQQVSLIIEDRIAEGLSNEIKLRVNDGFIKVIYEEAKRDLPKKLQRSQSQEVKVRSL